MLRAYTYNGARTRAYSRVLLFDMHYVTLDIRHMIQITPCDVAPGVICSILDTEHGVWATDRSKFAEQNGGLDQYFFDVDV